MAETKEDFADMTPPKNNALLSVWNRTKWLARALTIPNSWKKVAAYLAAWLVLWPAGMTFFPRAEKVLEQEGLNPKIVGELAPGKKIYIRTDNFWGKVHATFDRGALLSPLTYYRSVVGHADGGFARSGFTSLNTFGLCEVYIKKSRMTPEYYQGTLLHEIRHCSNDNVGLMGYRIFDNVLAEGDAEYHAAEVLAREKGQPALKKDFLLAAAGDDHDKLHDVSLYLDAQFRKAAIPSRHDIEQANKDASKIYEDIAVASMGKTLLAASEDADTRDACEKMPQMCSFDISKAGLSPLAQRRAELFRDAKDAYWAEAKKQGLAIEIKLPNPPAAGS